MADTLRYVGDTEPLKFELGDASGYLTTLPTATSLELLAVNQADETDTFTGPCVVIDPPEVDDTNHWNAKYALAAGDTAAPGTFDLFVTVTWGDGTITTFAVQTLEIRAKT